MVKETPRPRTYRRKTILYNFLTFVLPSIEFFSQKGKKAIFKSYISHHNSNASYLSFSTVEIRRNNPKNSMKWPFFL